jgi:outer membrane protein assembly factor BamB
MSEVSTSGPGAITGTAGSPRAENVTVYAGRGRYPGKRLLYAVDAATGDRQWSLKTDGAPFAAPTVVDGTVYIGLDNGYYLDETGGHPVRDRRCYR